MRRTVQTPLSSMSRYGWAVIALCSLLLCGGCKDDPASVPADTQPVEDVADTSDTADTVDPADVSDTADTSVGEDTKTEKDTHVVEDIVADIDDTSAPDLPLIEDTEDTQDTQDTQPPANACLEPGVGPDFQVSARADLRWKRERALERDLLFALALSSAEACGEVGLEGICFNLAHRVPLGGNAPVAAAMYRPVERPGITSALAIDRVTVAACGRRVDLDWMAAKGPSEPVVFTALDFTADSVSSSDANVSEQINLLYRRLLGRDASPAEIEILKGLTEPLPSAPDTPVTPREFAKALCFAVATTTEALLH